MRSNAQRRRVMSTEGACSQTGQFNNEAPPIMIHNKEGGGGELDVTMGPLSVKHDYVPISLSLYIGVRLRVIWEHWTYNISQKCHNTDMIRQLIDLLSKRKLIGGNFLDQ